MLLRQRAAPDLRKWEHLAQEPNNVTPTARQLMIRNPTIMDEHSLIYYKFGSYEQYVILNTARTGTASGTQSMQSGSLWAEGLLSVV